MKKFLTGAVSAALILSLIACVPSIGSNDGGKDFNTGNAEVDPPAGTATANNQGTEVTPDNGSDVQTPVDTDTNTSEKYADYPTYYIYNDVMASEKFTNPDGEEQDKAMVENSIVDMYSGEYNDYKYQELAAAIEEYNEGRKERAEDTLKNLTDMADEMYSEVEEGWIPTIYEINHAGVVRADKKVFSIMENCEMYYGGAHGGNFFSGVCFDSQTGERIEFEDVFTKTDDLADIIYDELLERYDEERFFETGAELKNEVKSAYDSGLGWLVTYDGVVFFFGDYTLSAYAYGSESVFINYKEYPDHLNPKYFEDVDQEYVIRAWHDVYYPVTTTSGTQQIIGFDWSRMYDSEYDFWSETYQTLNVFGEYYQEIDLNGSITDPLVYIIRRNGREYVYVQNQYYDGVGWLQTFEIVDGSLKPLEEYGVSIYFESNELKTADVSAVIGFRDDMTFAETPVNVADDGTLDWLDDRWFYYLDLERVESGEAFDNDYYVTNVDIKAHTADDEGRPNSDSVTIKSGTKIVPYCTDAGSFVTVIDENGDWYSMDIKIKNGYEFTVDGKYMREITDYVYNW